LNEKFNWVQPGMYPDTEEAGVGGSQSEVSPGKVSRRCYLKKKQKTTKTKRSRMLWLMPVILAT
jgi:hypothetical protein